jgi:hypothetical protein
MMVEIQCGVNKNSQTFNKVGACKQRIHTICNGNRASWFVWRTLVLLALSNVQLNGHNLYSIGLTNCYEEISNKYGQMHSCVTKSPLLFKTVRHPNIF